MFCGACGAKNPDGAAFCQSCGAPLREMQAEAVPQGGSAADSIQSSQRNKMIGIAAVAAAAIVVVFLAFNLLGGRGYESTVTKFLDASLDGDAETIISLLPDEMVDQALEELGYHPSDRDEAVEELNAALQSAAGSLKEALGDNLKVSYNVVSAEDLSASELLELRQSYSVYDIDVDGAKEVDVEMTVTATALDLSGTYTLTVPVVQVGRSWYLDAENFRIYSFSSFW